MGISKYYVFSKVAELGNITKTAEALNYTQSGISQIINSLERECGFPLIIRTKTGVRLTEAGARLLEPMRHLVKWETIIEQTASSIRGVDCGTLRVGMFSSVALQWMPRLLKELSTQHPNVEFDLTFGDYDQLQSLLYDDKLDCSFISESYSTGLAFVPLIEDEYFMVLPPNHKLTALERVPLKALNGASFILPAEGPFSDLSKLMAKFKPVIKYRVKDDFSAISLAEQGLGITILPKLVLIGVNSSAAIRPIEGKWVRSLGIATHSMQYATPVTTLFIDKTVEFVENFKKEHYMVN